MDNTILTIIVPVFNTGHVLSRCIDSIINQSLKDVDIIIVNDASTDNSNEIIERLQLRHPQIQCINRDRNGGPGASRNDALHVVNSKYVAFLDSDDWVDTDAYLTAVTALEDSPDCDIAIFGIKTEYNNSVLSTLRYSYNNRNVISGKFAINLLANMYSQDIRISALLGNKIFLTELLKENRLHFAVKYFEDTVFTYQSFICAKNIILLPEVYYHYYQRETSIMHSFSKKYIDDLFGCFILLEQYINSKGLMPEHKDSFFAFFERCRRSTMNTLFINEQSVVQQKEYIRYFYDKFLVAFSLADYIQYLDINRIKELML